MHNNGMSSLISFWSVLVDFRCDEASAVWCSVSARCKKTNLNSAICCRQHTRLSVESARLGIHLIASRSVWKISLQTSQQGWRNNTLHTTARYWLYIGSFAPWVQNNQQTHIQLVYLLWLISSVERHCLSSRSVHFCLLYDRLANVEEPTKTNPLLSLLAARRPLFRRLPIWKRCAAPINELSYWERRQHQLSSAQSD